MTKLLNNIINIYAAPFDPNYYWGRQVGDLWHTYWFLVMVPAAYLAMQFVWLYYYFIRVTFGTKKNSYAGYTPKHGYLRVRQRIELHNDFDHPGYTLWDRFWTKVYWMIRTKPPKE